MGKPPLGSFHETYRSPRYLKLAAFHHRISCDWLVSPARMSKKKHLKVVLFSSAFVLTAAAFLIWRVISLENAEAGHAKRHETELRIASDPDASFQAFLAGLGLGRESALPSFEGTSVWLPPGNYFVKSTGIRRMLWYPVSLLGYRSGPDDDGSYVVTLRPIPINEPPRLLPSLPSFEFIPSGNFLLGDRLNPRECHHVWLTGFFVAPYEVTNEEFRIFLADSDGYANASNWTQAGLRWRKNGSSHASAGLVPSDPEYVRFGQAGQPVTQVNWFEANAFCKWLTRKIGGGRWWYSLPTDAEWEKAARGPDNFDYALGR